MLIIIIKLKRFLALGIFACFFLPLSQCTSKASGPPESQPAKVYVYTPVEQLKFKSFDEALLISIFFSPLLASLLQYGIRKRAGTILLNTLEIAFSILNIYWIFQILMFYGELRYGGVLLLTSYFLYVPLSILMIYKYITSKII